LGKKCECMVGDRHPRLATRRLSLEKKVKGGKKKRKIGREVKRRKGRKKRHQVGEYTPHPKAYPRLRSILALISFTTSG